MLNPHQASASAAVAMSMLVNGYDTDAWESIIPSPHSQVSQCMPIQVSTLYNASGNAGIDADAWYGYVLTSSKMMQEKQLVMSGCSL